MRLHIKDYSLGAESYVTLTSLEDGKQQFLDTESIPKWYNLSAYFIGDVVLVELHVDPGEKDIFVVIDEVIVGSAGTDDGDLAPDAKTICGDADNRISSTDPRVGRLVFTYGGICTGWLIPNGLVLSAGHCGDPDGDFTGVIMEFNVPQSTADGGRANANPEDRYAVNTAGMSFEADGTGEDWAVFRLDPNNVTSLRAHDVQGFFKITTTTPVEDTTMRVTGHGIDPFPPGPGPGTCGEDDEYFCNSDSLTQQTAIGRFDELSGTTLEYEVDTMPAGSGSPVIWNGIGYAVGIHTDGGCGDIVVGDENHGTWFGYEALRDAILAANPSNAVWVDAEAPIFLFDFGSVFYPYKTVSKAVALAPSGSVINIYSGSYPAPFVAGQNGKSMTLVSQLGGVVIGE